MGICNSKSQVLTSLYGFLAGCVLKNNVLKEQNMATNHLKPQAIHSIYKSEDDSGALDGTWSGLVSGLIWSGTWYGLVPGKVWYLVWSGTLFCLVPGLVW